MKLFEESHPDQQPSYHELREEFRATHLADLHSQFGQRHSRGWNQIITELGRKEFTPEGWALEMLRRLDALVVQDFGLPEAPEALSRKLEEQGQASLLHESVTWDPSVEGTADHDASPCDLSSMTDDQISDYVAREIERSKRER